MFSNAASPSSDASGSSSGNKQESLQLQGLRTLNVNCRGLQSSAAAKRKRSLPGTPDPNAEVIALSPRTLLANNRFVCEICNKGFQRDQNLQLHRRGHNLPWKLKQRTSNEIRKRVYVCPEPSCVHHDPARALGDLTGIKKHFCRKHGEKKWKCDKCSKRYAVHSDWKAHLKTCGTREYRCDCGTLFSRRESFITHRAFCDSLAEENARVSVHQHDGFIEKGGTDFQNNAMGDGFGRPSVSYQTDSQLSEGPGNSLSPSLGFSKPGMLQDPVSGFPLNECGAQLPSKWVQGGMCRSATSLSRAPELSLWPGLGPGPSLPGVMGMRREAPLMPSPRNINGISDSMEDFDAYSKLSSSMMILPSFQGSDIFANVLSPTTSYGRPQGSTGQMTSNVMSSFTGMDRARYGNGRSGGSASTMSGLASSSCYLKQQGQCSASAQTSATALLQKAGQMGATSSNSLFQGLGMEGGSDTSNSMATTQRGTKPGKRNDLGRPGVGSGARNAPGDGASTVQDFMDLLSGGEMLDDMSSSFLGRSHGRYIQQNADKSHMLKGKLHDPQSDGPLGRSVVP